MFRRAVRDFATMYELPGMGISYSVNDDDMGHLNDNAEILSELCKDSMLLVLLISKLCRGTSLVVRRFGSVTLGCQSLIPVLCLIVL